MAETRFPIRLSVALPSSFRLLLVSSICVWVLSCAAPQLVHAAGQLVHTAGQMVNPIRVIGNRLFGFFLRHFAFFPHLAAATFLPISDRSSAVSFFIRALLLFNPPRLPCARRTPTLQRSEYSSSITSLTPLAEKGKTGDPPMGETAPLSWGEIACFA